MSREWLGLLLGLLGVTIFGASLPMARLAVADFEPLFVTFARPAGAGLLALVVLLVLRKPLPPLHMWKALIISSTALVWGWPGLTNYAMKLVPASHGAVIAGLLPLVTAVSASVMVRDRQPPIFWICAILGAAIVAGFALHEGGGALVGADILLIAAVLICSVGYVAAGDLSKRMPSWEVVSWMLVVSLPIALAGVWASWPYKGLAAAPSAQFGLGYVTLFSQYLGFFAWNAGLALGGIARVSQVQLLQVFVTLAVSALVLGERIMPWTWGIAGLIILVIASAQAAARHRRS